MIERTARPLARRVLIVDDELTHPTSAGGHAVQGLADELRARGVEVVAANSCEDGMATVVSDSAIHCVFLNWTLGKENGHGGNGSGNGHDICMRHPASALSANPIVRYGSPSRSHRDTPAW